jgi:hypothetical protein
MESRFHRRRVLELASSGVLAWSLGPTLSGCRRIPPSQAGELAGARDRARSEGKPLLVLLADPDNPSQRGIEWSAYFDLASDQALAELSGCELAFAVPEQVRAAFPSMRIVETSLFHAVLVEPDGRTFLPVPIVRPEPGWQVLVESKDSERLRPWIVQFEGTLHAVLSTSRSLPRVAPGSDPHGEARALRARLREAAPAGGKWAKGFGGCGSIEFEDGSVFDEPSENGLMIACGMAHHSETSRRFLWLYSERKS